MTRKEEIKNAIRILGDFTTKELYQFLPNVPRSTIRRELQRIVKENELQRVKRGTYSFEPEITPVERPTVSDDWIRHDAKVSVYCDRAKTIQRNESLYAFTFYSTSNEPNQTLVERELKQALIEEMDKVCKNESSLSNKTYFDDVLTVGYSKLEVSFIDVDDEAIYPKIKTGNDFIKNFDKSKWSREQTQAKLTRMQETGTLKE
jgi:hypothetical protein